MDPSSNPNEYNIEWMLDMLFGRNPEPETIKSEVSENPTLGNNSIGEVNNVDDIIRDLREKFNEAESHKDQLEEYKGEIDNAIDDLDTYLADLDDLINSLDSLPEVSIYVDLDTVSFDS